MRRLVGVNNSTFGEFVFGAAIRALDRTGVDDVKKDARMHAPEGRFSAGTVKRQIFGSDDHWRLILAGFGCLAHQSSQNTNLMPAL